MNHATARLDESNPSLSDGAGSARLEEAMAHARQAAERTSPDNDSNAAPEPTFFRTLRRQGQAEAPNGMDWLTSERAKPGAYAISRVDCCLAGLDGVLAVLKANVQARDDDPEQSLSPFLTDRLHHAAQELVIAADRAMEEFRTAMRVDF